MDAAIAAPRIVEGLVILARGDIPTRRQTDIYPGSQIVTPIGQGVVVGIGDGSACICQDNWRQQQQDHNDLRHSGLPAPRRLTALPGENLDTIAKCLSPQNKSQSAEQREQSAHPKELADILFAVQAYTEKPHQRAKRQRRSTPQVDLLAYWPPEQPQ